MRPPRRQFYEISLGGRRHYGLKFAGASFRPANLFSRHRLCMCRTAPMQQQYATVVAILYTSWIFKLYVLLHLLCSSIELRFVDLDFQMRVCKDNIKQVSCVLFQTNTFQAVLVTDGRLSFVTLNYGVLEWTRSGQVTISIFFTYH